MKNKKLWLGALVVYIVLSISETVMNAVLLKDEYLGIASIVRPEGEVKIWVFFVTYLFLSFFFTWIFSKGYEGKGIMEGVRYGLAVGLMMMLPNYYDKFALFPIPYSFALKGFLLATLELVLAGIALALVFGAQVWKKPRGHKVRSSEAARGEVKTE